MTTSSFGTEDRPGSIGGANLLRGMSWVLWQIIRLPVFTLLVILEPLVRFLLVGIALLGILVSLFLKFSGAAPHLPFWTMLAMSLGFGLMLIAYYAAIRLFSK